MYTLWNVLLNIDQKLPWDWTTWKHKWYQYNKVLFSHALLWTLDGPTQDGITTFTKLHSIQISSKDLPQQVITPALLYRGDNTAWEINSKKMTVKAMTYKVLKWIVKGAKVSQMLVHSALRIAKWWMSNWGIWKMENKMYFFKTASYELPRIRTPTVYKRHSTYQAMLLSKSFIMAWIWNFLPTQLGPSCCSSCFSC